MKSLVDRTISNLEHTIAVLTKRHKLMLANRFVFNDKVDITCMYTSTMKGSGYGLECPCNQCEHRRG